jgi:murein DD-endopeptidase MepM/ murein hydrolase activator NlpD
VKWPARGFAVWLALAAALSGCPEKEARPVPPPRDGKLGKQRCTALPGKQNKRLPVFQRPFDGAFPVINLFDHQTPGEYRAFDPGSRQLSYCGLDMLGLADGHEGYSWAVPVGTPVFPVADGEVVAAGIEPDFFCQLTKQMVSGQQVVEVRHPGLGGAGFVTTYRHLSQVLVKEGDKVEAAKRLGLSGQSGCATEPVLYFSVKRLTGTGSGKPAYVDPYGWDGPADDPWAKNPEGAVSLFLWKDGEAPTLGSR